MTRKAPASTAAKAKPSKPASKKVAKPATKAAAKANTDEPKKVAAGDKPKRTAKVTVGATPRGVRKTSVERQPSAPVSEEELSLASLYADDMQAPVAAHGEFRDARTPDEDRPMVPEHTAKAVRQAAHKEVREERRDRWKRMREDRKARRDARQQGEPAGATAVAAKPMANGVASPRHAERNPERHPDRHADRNAASKPQAPRQAAIAPTAPRLALGPSASGRELAVAAEAVFAGMASAQSIPVRQLSHMMKKRDLVSTDPERLIQDLKWQLIIEERQRRANGFRGVVAYRGRDLFATGPARLSATADSEAALMATWQQHQAAVRAALTQQVAALSGVALERLVHAYLEAQRFRNISWVKRATPYAYATALPPHGNTPVLISVRGGTDEIDRRGIGELRVGVEAKELPYGMLFSPGALSADALAEMARPGRSIAIWCGESLIDALLATGVGVQTSHAPIAYLDENFLNELSAG